MKILFVFLLACAIVSCDHLIVGDAAGKKLIHHEIAQYNAIPLVKRVKEVFYSNPDQRVINAITAYDNTHTKATASITAGGIGYTYVNLKLKSERGEGLHYDIGIYS